MIHHTSDAICPACEEKLSLAHPTLQDWFRNHVKPNFPDAHVSWSSRSQAEQEQMFHEGKSELHFPHSAHNKTPALALDLFQIKLGVACFDPVFYVKVNDYNQYNGITLKWGGNWKSLGDKDHFELDLNVAA